MNKYKICPVCKTKNNPSFLECSNCGNDIMGVRIVDDSNATVGSCEISGGDCHGNEVLVRICECGYENTFSARKCARCGEDISDIIPCKQSSVLSEKNYTISSLDGLSVLDLECPSEHIIGRENELADYLKSKTFVSRKHALLTVTTEGLFLQNLSSANGTFVNNEKLDDNNAYSLCEGDEIGLGGFEDKSGRQDLAAYYIVGKK